VLKKIVARERRRIGALTRFIDLCRARCIGGAEGPSAHFVALASLLFVLDMRIKGLKKPSPERFPSFCFAFSVFRVR
jgi:hypothetical protein